jgi:hypothetical protein
MRTIECYGRNLQLLSVQRINAARMMLMHVVVVAMPQIVSLVDLRSGKGQCWSSKRQDGTKHNRNLLI